MTWSYDQKTIKVPAHAASKAYASALNVLALNLRHCPHNSCQSPHLSVCDPSPSLRLSTLLLRVLKQSNSKRLRLTQLLAFFLTILGWWAILNVAIRTNDPLYQLFPILPPVVQQLPHLLVVLLPDLSWHSRLVLLRVSVGLLVALEDIVTQLGKLFTLGKQGVRFPGIAIGVLWLVLVLCGCL